MSAKPRKTDRTYHRSEAKERAAIKLTQAIARAAHYYGFRVAWHWQQSRGAEPFNEEEAMALWPPLEKEIVMRDLANTPMLWAVNRKRGMVEALDTGREWQQACSESP